MPDSYNSVIGHLSGQNHVCQTIWSDIVRSKTRRKPKGLSCICLVDCESDHDVRSLINKNRKVVTQNEITMLNYLTSTMVKLGLAVSRLIHRRQLGTSLYCTW